MGWILSAFARLIYRASYGETSPERLCRGGGPAFARLIYRARYGETSPEPLRGGGGAMHNA